MSFNTTLRPDVASSSSSDNDDDTNFLFTHYTLLVVSAVVGSALLVIVSFWLREVCYDRFGIEVCAGSVSTARRREIRRFQLRALQLQRQMERDLLDSSVSVQKQRKEVYGAFLDKFSKVLTEEDITEQVEDENDNEEPQRYLRLRPHDGCQEFVVEALCIICFKDYEVGEQVVWSSKKSTEECRHVYHKDCILRWISTGKQNCPVCRHAFVPQLPLKHQHLGNQAGDSSTNQAQMPHETLPSRGPDAV